MFQTTNQFRGSLFWESLKHTNFVHSGNICVFRSGTQGWKQTHDDGHGWINSWLWMIMAPHMAWQVPVTSNPRMNLDTNCKFHGGLKSLKWQKTCEKILGQPARIYAHKLRSMPVVILPKIIGLKDQVHTNPGPNMGSLRSCRGTMVPNEHGGYENPSFGQCQKNWRCNRTCLLNLGS